MNTTGTSQWLTRPTIATTPRWLASRAPAAPQPDQGVDALTTDDTILAGYAAQAQYKGKLKVVGKTFSTERYGIGLQHGDTAMCQEVTDAIKSMVSDGSWQKAVDANLGAAGYKAGAGGAIAPLGSTLIALIKNTTVAAVIGASEAAGLMSQIVENETGEVPVFAIFAIGFVILTLPVGILFTTLSRRLAVKRRRRGPTTCCRGCGARSGPPRSRWCWRGSSDSSSAWGDCRTTGWSAGRRASSSSSSAPSRS
jgi:Bacterial extracellular solute-binding proteins, family 3